MTVSNGNVARLTGACLLAAAVAAAPVWPASATMGGSLTLAQLGPPIVLGPGTRPRREEPPRKTVPAAEVPGEAAAPLQPRGVVEVDSLTAPDPESVGLIDKAHGGLGVDLWNGTDRGLVQRLLPRLRVSVESATARSLLRRLLLSRARAPSGKASGRSLLSLRAERLLEMGDVKSAVKLLDAAPLQLRDEGLSHIEIEGRFLLNDNAGACRKVRPLILQYRSNYWQRAMAFCMALSQQHERSAMISDILRERASDVAPAFFALVEALAGDDTVQVDSLKDPDGLMISMMRAANVKLPPDVVESKRPTVLRAVARSPNAELELRLDAAERAEAAGAVTAQELAEIYASVPFEASELVDPVVVARQNWGPRGRALLIRAAAGKETPRERAEILRQAWRISREQGGYRSMLRVSAPIVQSIEPAEELATFANQAGLSLFATGNTDRAMGWYRMAQATGKTNKDAAAAAIALWPLVRLAAAESGPLDQQTLRRWQARRASEKTDPDLHRASLVYTLLESLGDAVGNAAWRDLVGRARMSAPADPALWHSLRAAAAEKRLGETVLLALLALGQRDLAQASPLTLSAVIAALRQVGLDAEARALAVEAAIAAGV